MVYAAGKPGEVSRHHLANPGKISPSPPETHTALLEYVLITSGSHIY